MAVYATTTVEFGGQARRMHFRQRTTDTAVIKLVLIDQQYDLKHLRRLPELLDFLKRQEDAGRKPLIVDAGANIGASALYFAGKMPHARVVAIEPEKDNFDLLRRNVEGLNVTPMHAAISASAGRARVIDPGEGAWGYRTMPVGSDEAPADAVARITINEIFEQNAGTFFPFIVKIDIEGAEQDLFSANTEWVARTPLIIVELHDWLLPKAGTSGPFLKCISQLDRDFVYRGEDVYSIANNLGAIAAEGR